MQIHPRLASESLLQHFPAVKFAQSHHSCRILNENSGQGKYSFGACLNGWWDIFRFLLLRNQKTEYFRKWVVFDQLFFFNVKMDDLAMIVIFSFLTSLWAFGLFSMAVPITQSVCLLTGSGTSFANRTRRSGYIWRCVRSGKTAR